MAENSGSNMVPESIEKYRKFFEGAGADICSVIQYAVEVAISDCPNELKRRRDKITEMLFSATSSKCNESDCMALAETLINAEDDDDDDVKGSSDGNGIANDNNDEGEALTKVMEQESEVLTKVFSIKQTLANPDQSASQLCESLRTLESMQLTTENLHATGIDKQVNLLGKHNSKAVKSLVKELIRSWKDMADEWFKNNNVAAAMAIAGTSSVSVDCESRLPNPPLEEDAFLATHTTSVDISQSFDGMDDDGNLFVPEKLKKEDSKKNENQCTGEEHHTTFKTSA